MRVVIFAGGTGSIALQRGLYSALESKFDGIETKIIVNAYDNGLSSGAVRLVMDGRILGPSDVRKNHATRLALVDPGSAWLDFLNCRFTASSDLVRDLLRDKAARLFEDLDQRNSSGGDQSKFVSAIDEYFESPLAAAIDYRDFSFSNIVYAGIAKANGYSLRAAATVMADMMGIPDTVLLNDDESLYLGAITESGKRISDEGDIVSWGNEEDPFVDIFFMDADRRECRPLLCLEAWKAILEADLIILSPGTQWSSLIPTYASDGFREAVCATKAKVLMIMNRTPDRDSPSQSASDIINILVPRYFDEGRLHVVADTNGHPRMRSLSHAAASRLASFTPRDLSTPLDSAEKHDPKRLSDAVAYAYFEEFLDSDFYVFDYDDTLVDRGSKLNRSSEFNVRGVSRLNCLTNVGICTGNTVEAVQLPGEPAAYNEKLDPIKPLIVFADGGANMYLYNTHSAAAGVASKSGPAKCIYPDALLPSLGRHGVNELVKTLRRVGTHSYKVELRGDVVVALRPIRPDDRHAVLRMLQHLVNGSELEVRECGKTTIEICRRGLSKRHALEYLRLILGEPFEITYIGDEFESGNDKDIWLFANRKPGVHCLQVSGPSETAFFISTLISRLTKHVEH